MLAVACAPEAEPTEFSPGEEIPLGMISIRVIKLEVAREGGAELNLLRTEPEDLAYVLHVRWTGGEKIPSQRDRSRYVEMVLRDRIEIFDSDGDRYVAVGAVPRGQYLSRMYSQVLTQDWVVIFDVPEVATGLGARIENPDPTGAAYRVAVIPLGS